MAAGVEWCLTHGGWDRCHNRCASCGGALDAGERYCRCRGERRSAETVASRPMPRVHRLPDGRLAPVLSGREALRELYARVG